MTMGPPKEHRFPMGYGAIIDKYDLRFLVKGVPIQVVCVNR